MYTSESMRLNGFVKSHIARPSDLYARLGRVQRVFHTSDEDIPLNFNGTQEQLEYIQRFDEIQAEEERRRAFFEHDHEKESESDSDSDPGK